MSGHILLRFYERPLYRDLLILIFSFVLVIICASFIYGNAVNMTNWIYDDSEHLSIAYSLFHGKGLSKPSIDLEASSIKANIPSLKSYDHISNPLRSKPPLYLVLLGAWLTLTQANYNNWFRLGILLNFVFVIAFITIFYFFVKRHFGMDIAAYSTPLVVVTPLFLWFTVRVRPEILLYVFMISAIYFAALKITYRNVILTGVFAGLCHLIHPVGYLIGVTFLVYLAFKRKFRATLILLAIWGTVVAPWMVRNYIVFGDVNQGFGLPLPKSILIALGLITPNALYSNIAARSGDIGSIAANTPLDVILKGMSDQFTNLFGMQYFMLFIAFSLFAYLSFPSIQRKLGKSYLRIILLVSAIFIYIRALQLILVIPNENGLLIQGIAFIAIPVLIYLYLRLSSHHRDIFDTEERPAYTILAILAVISFIPFIMWAEITGSPAEVRVIAASLYMVVPLSVIGIKKILGFSISHFYSAPEFNRKGKFLVSALMIGILVIFSYSQISAGIVAVNGLSGRFTELQSQKDIHKWLNENIPPDAKIASDRPHSILLRTGHDAINFHPAYRDNISYERWIIKKFDIDYIVLYVNQPLLLTDLKDFHLETVYNLKGGFVYKVIAG